MAADEQHSSRVILLYPSERYALRCLARHFLSDAKDAAHAEQQPTVVALSDAQATELPAAALTADVVVCDLLGCEREVVAAVMAIARAKQAGSSDEVKRAVFIAITSPLAWAATPPPLPPAEPSSPANTTAPAAYTEQDAPARQPAACAAAAFRAEHAVIRAARPGVLATHVVLPGILYGWGEDDAHLHPLFRAAWDGATLTQVGAGGSNRLPTLHVRGLAAYLMALAAASADALTLAAQAAAAKGPLARRALRQTLADRGSGTAAAAAWGTAFMTATASGLTAEGLLPPGPPQYLVVADGPPVTQAALLAAVATAFGIRPSAQIERLAWDAALVGGLGDGGGGGCESDCDSSSNEVGDMGEQHQGLVAPGQQLTEGEAEARAWLQVHTLDLPLRTTPLPGYLPAAAADTSGFLASLDTTVAEMLAERNLAPLRLLIRGPPAVGKSHLAARLAWRYGLRLVGPSTIMAESPRCDPELQKALATELAGKEGRASARTMARLLQHMLARDPVAARRGWVLDGWPRTLAQARLAFSPGAVAAAAAASQGPPGGGQRRTSSVGDVGAGKEKKKGGASNGPAPRKSSAGNSDASAVLAASAATDTSLANDLVPQWVVQLDAPKEQLMRRVRALAAAEEAAAQAAAAASGALVGSAPAGAHGGGQGRPAKRSSIVGKADMGAIQEVHQSHNTERDFLRRYDAWRTAVAEDTADLAVRRAAAASAEAADAGAAPQAVPPTTRPTSVSAAAADVGPAPTTCGLAGLLADAGARVVALDNPDDPAMAGTEPPWAPTTEAEEGHLQQQGSAASVLATKPPTGATLPPLLPPGVEASLVEQLGPAHNYSGFPEDPAHDKPDIATAQAEEAAAAVAVAAAVAANAKAEEDAVKAAVQAQVARAATARQARASATAAPLRNYLLVSVVPAVTAGLAECVASRPSNPINVLVSHLTAAADRAEAGYSDPYSDAVYGLQLAKVEAKRARDAARAEAARAAAGETIGTGVQEAEAAGAEEVAA